MALIIGVVIVLLILFGFLCYKKAPPTEAIVVTGFGLARPKVVCGKGTFVLPVLQRADRLNMRLLKIDVKTPETGVKTQNGVSLWIDSVVTIQVYSENSTVLDEEVKASGLKDAKAYIMSRQQAAISNFLGMNEQGINDKVNDVLQGNLREIVSDMTVDQILTNRKQMALSVIENARPDLAKMGLEVVTFNVQDIRDAILWLHCHRDEFKDTEFIEVVNGNYPKYQVKIQQAMNDEDGALYLSCWYPLIKSLSEDCMPEHITKDRVKQQAIYVNTYMLIYQAAKSLKDGGAVKELGRHLDTDADKITNLAFVLFCMELDMQWPVGMKGPQFTESLVAYGEAPRKAETEEANVFLYARYNDETGIGSYGLCVDMGDAFVQSSRSGHAPNEEEFALMGAIEMFNAIKERDIHDVVVYTEPELAKARASVLLARSRRKMMIPL